MRLWSFYSTGGERAGDDDLRQEQGQKLDIRSILGGKTGTETCNEG